MLKYMKVILIVFSLAMILFSLASCNEEYYDMDDIQYRVIAPDTVFLDSSFTIKGSINQPLKIRVYIRDFRTENLLGVIKSSGDSISCKLTGLDEGYNVFCAEVHYKRKRGHGASLSDFIGVIIKKKPEKKPVDD